MKTTLDILLILYKVISNTSSITSTISGGVYKEQRPVNSDKEDIVIECESITGEQLQECSPTIKIHVPNKPVFIDNIQDLNQPDNDRINELTTLVLGTVKEYYNNNYWFYAEGQSLVPEDHEHYTNIKIKFNFLNTTN